VPNAKQHAMVGLGVGIVGYALYCHFSHRDFNLGEAALATGACVLGSLCPDVLEPAVHSWHRGPCHSVAVGGVSGHVATKPLFATQPPTLEAVLLSFFALGYLSHLVLDARTPRCLPAFG
jgi:membrane-bound metal-dependent hydrolase YbcI (DUF457 family)